MTLFVALLRGINVGGNNKVSMAELRALLTGIGFGNVQTYIQSGNAVFSADVANSETVRAQLEMAIAKHFGFVVSVLVLSATEFFVAAKFSPFAPDICDPAMVHLGFMAASPHAAALDNLRTKPQGTDLWLAVDRVFYLYAPVGLGKSILAPFIERTLKVPVTFRNWRTVLTLKGMVETSAGQ